jgi:hypothetical protein
LGPARPGLTCHQVAAALGPARPDMPPQVWLGPTSSVAKVASVPATLASKFAYAVRLWARPSLPWLCFTEMSFAPRSPETQLTQRSAFCCLPGLLSWQRLPMLMHTFLLALPASSGTWRPTGYDAQHSFDGFGPGPALPT